MTVYNGHGTFGGGGGGGSGTGGGKGATKASSPGLNNEYRWSYRC